MGWQLAIHGPVRESSLALEKSSGICFVPPLRRKIANENFPFVGRFLEHDPIAGGKVIGFDDFFGGGPKAAEPSTHIAQKSLRAGIKFAGICA